MRHRSTFAAVLIALIVGGLLLSNGQVDAQTNAGTVKLFDGDKELPANDPKVCGPFTVRGLNFEAGESVAISIVGHGGPNAGPGSFNATVTVGGDGAFATAPITLAEGMYKLDSEDGEGGGDKNKVFKVECEPQNPPPENPPPENPPPENPPPENPPPVNPPPVNPPPVNPPPTPGGQVNPPGAQVTPPAAGAAQAPAPSVRAATAVRAQPRTTG
jgi:hypothetical protein